MNRGSGELDGIPAGRKVSILIKGDAIIYVGVDASGSNTGNWHTTLPADGWESVTADHSNDNLLVQNSTDSSTIYTFGYMFRKKFTMDGAD